MSTDYFKQIITPLEVHQILIRPLKLGALKKLTENGRISVNILIPMGTLVGFGEVDPLNDYADEHILNGSIVGSLSDLSYKLVGCSTDEGDGHAWLSGSVIINVNADVSDILAWTED